MTFSYMSLLFFYLNGWQGVWAVMGCGITIALFSMQRHHRRRTFRAAIPKGLGSHANRYRHCHMENQQSKPAYKAREEKASDSWHLLSAHAQVVLSELEGSPNVPMPRP